MCNSYIGGNYSYRYYYYLLYLITYLIKAEIFIFREVFCFRNLPKYLWPS